MHELQTNSVRASEPASVEPVYCSLTILFPFPEYRSFT